MRNCLIDIETLGPAPDGALAQIGVAYFDDDPAKIELEEVVVDVGSSLAVGMWLDWGTVAWWLQQPEIARRKLLDPGALPLPNALAWLVEGIQMRHVEFIWAKPAMFDLVILARAFELCGMAALLPWQYGQPRKARCASTLLTIAGIGKEQETVPKIPHVAKLDAEAHAIDVIRAMKLMPPQAK